MWNAYIHRNSKRWRDIIQNWLIDGRRNGKKILLVHYEDMIKNVRKQTKRMLDFLGIKALHKMDINFIKYNRHYNSSDELFDPFTSEQKQHVLSTVNEAIEAASRAGMGTSIDLTRYL